LELLSASFKLVPSFGSATANLLLLESFFNCDCKNFCNPLGTLPSKQQDVAAATASAVSENGWKETKSNVFLATLREEKKVSLISSASVFWNLDSSET
jgi:hypothetical protein